MFLLFLELIFVHYFFLFIINERAILMNKKVGRSQKKISDYEQVNDRT